MESKTNSGERNFLHGAAGSISGAIGAIIVQPLDVVKTRQQQAIFRDIKMQQTPLKEISSVQKYRSTLETAKTILREEGALGLWKGTSPTMIRIIPGAGLYFLFLHQITGYMRTNPDQALTAMQALLAGSVARTTVSITLLPITVVKTRFEGLGTNHYRGVMDALKTIATKEGIRGLFSGLWPTILRDAPFSGIYFLFYDKIKSNLKKRKIMHDTFVHITAGSVAGLIATIVTHPQDVIIRSMAKENGARAFYKGLFPRLIRRPLIAAITWTIYEAIIQQPKK